MVPPPSASGCSWRRVPRASGDGPETRPVEASAVWCSPRERGWSGRRARRALIHPVFPARAGMVRRRRRRRRRTRGVPRASGDGPSCRSSWSPCRLCSPRERGWSAHRMRRAGARCVFPARAGMVLRTCSLSWSRRCVPRASGDGPDDDAAPLIDALCSPRERGWSDPEMADRAGGGVFPARAGMVPSRPHNRTSCPCVPRASGDGPVPVADIGDHLPCSPRERGWSKVAGLRYAYGWVFPARAGMVPRRRFPRLRPSCVPRASGDGPVRLHCEPLLEWCSPRERGWSPLPHCGCRRPLVFPARAGMVPVAVSSRAFCSCVPRASGDGPGAYLGRRGPNGCSPRERGWSGHRPGRHAGRRCSPRERGWSREAACARRACAVFPARAGMVRSEALGRAGAEGVPRASGDGPAEHAREILQVMCSPRERGWSVLVVVGVPEVVVFPARAGMVRPARQSRRRSRVFPARAGMVRRAAIAGRLPSQCSPRERGWSDVPPFATFTVWVFPARAGMVPTPALTPTPKAGVPRASGDGPQRLRSPVIRDGCSPRERGWSRPGGGSAPWRGPCSPRERGWSLLRRDHVRPPHVFPARAGMVRPPPTGMPSRAGVPRASGDGPVVSCPCSVGGGVFPARAGMVPRSRARHALPRSVPRASGDGPCLPRDWRQVRECSPRERGWSLSPT